MLFSPIFSLVGLKRKSSLDFFWGASTKWKIFTPAVGTRQKARHINLAPEPNMISFVNQSELTGFGSDLWVSPVWVPIIGHGPKE